MSPISDAVVFSVILAVNLLLVGSLVVGSLAVTFRLLKNVSPRARYVISLASFVVTVIVPVTLSAAGPPKPVPDAVARHESLRNSAAQPDDIMLSGEILSGLTEAPVSVVSNRLGALAASFSNSAAGHFFFLLWVAGGLFLTLREVAAHRRLRAAVQNWKPAHDSERDVLFCPEGVSLYFDVDERPATVGLVNPAVVLPTYISGVLPLDSVRHILRHEVAHARWRDPLVNSILRLLRSVFWVCPALWLIERCARAEMEAAADHAVVTEFSANSSEFEATALKYATTLLAAAQQFNSFGPHKYHRPQTMSLGTGSRLEGRVRRLLEYSAEPRHGRVATATVIAALSLTVMAAMPLASRPPETESASHVADVKTDTPFESETAGQNFLDDVKVGANTGWPSGHQSFRLRASDAGRRGASAAPSHLSLPSSEAVPREDIGSLRSSRKVPKASEYNLRALDTRLRNMDALEAGLDQLKRARPLGGR